MCKRFMTIALSAVLMTAASGLLSGVQSADAAITTVYGDVNGDGVVNVFDSMRIKRSIIGETSQFTVTNWKEASGTSGGDVPTGEAASKVNELILTVGKHEDSEKNISPRNGIDVSKWQDVIDWQKVKAAGIDFAMIKAGEGTEIEPTFIRNITGAKAAGIECGIYWFANAFSVEDSILEAKACLETIAPYQLEYPVAYDFEYRTFKGGNPLETDRTACTDVIITFLDEIEKAGCYPIVYSNKDFPDRYLEKNRITDRFDFWYANYHIEEPDEVCGIWQKSCTGKIDGIKYDVDLDVSYIDYKSVMEKYHLNGF